jgi:hemerythrin-like domain-containing protein
LIQPTIRRGPAPPPGDAVEHLLECHARIRRYGAVARRLVDAPATPEEIAGAAADVHRYFSIAYPLHGGDEEELLVPLLAGRAPTPAETSALEGLAAEHAALDARLARLLPRWAELAARPEATPARSALGEDTTAFLAGVEAHLALEERVVFPAARRLLSTEERTELVRRMQARRSR